MPTSPRHGGVRTGPRRRLRILRSGVLWRVIAPVILAASTLVLGTYSAGFTWNGFWKATGLLIGETSYQEFDEFTNRAEMSPHAPAATDASPGTSSRTTTSLEWRRHAWQLARMLGLLFIFNALFILLFEAISEHGRQIRVLCWAPHLGKWALWRRKYVLICGLGRKGRDIALALRAQGCRVVAIEKDQNNPFISDLREDGAVVFEGDATDKALLIKAGAARADTVYLLSADDSTDYTLVQQIERLLEKRERPACLEKPIIDASDCACCTSSRCTTCHVGLEGYRSRMVLENQDRTGRMLVRCFNIYEVITRDFFGREVWPQVAACERCHLAFHVFGFTPVAKEIVLHLLRTLHLPGGLQREIRVYCRDAERRQRELVQELPCLANAMGLTLDPVAKAAAAWDGLFPHLRFIELPRANSLLLADSLPLYHHIETGWQNHVFYCLDDGMKSQVLAELIQPRLQWAADKSKCPANTQIHSYVYYNHSDADQGCQQPDKDSSAPAGARKTVTGPLQFGFFGQICRSALVAEPVAERHARAIAAYFHTRFPEGQKITMEEEQLKLRTLLDNSVRLQCYLRQLWEWSPEWKRDSNRQVVDHIPVKLATLGMVLDDAGEIQWADGGDRQDNTARSFGELATSVAKDMLHEAEHHRWCAERFIGGWLPLPPADAARWADEKSFPDKVKRNLRRHIDMVPFSSLASEEKTKDTTIIEAIPLLSWNLGDIVRKALPEQMT